MSLFDDPQRLRSRPPGVSDPIQVMEEPALLDVLGDPSGLRILDLGCGEAALGAVMLAGGARSYRGIDSSAGMIRAARETLQGTAGEAERGAIEEFRAAPDSFDLVVSRLALHYVADLAPVIAACHACLAPGGRLVFTVMHPVITSHDARASTDELRSSWVVDDYFATGPREQAWLGGRTTWHHRTVEDYVALLLGAGFTLAALRECHPRSERFADAAERRRRNRIPLFLLLAGVLSG